MVAHATVRGREWVRDLWRLCIGVVAEPSAVEVDDEKQLSAEGDVDEAVLSITLPMPAEGVQRLTEELREKLASGVNARLVKAVQPDGFRLHSAHILVEYFRREFAVDSRMVVHVASCVKLTHVPSGTVARSTRHRSRALNQNDALLLLESLVAERHDAA